MMKKIVIILNLFVCASFGFGQTQPLQPIIVTEAGRNVDSAAVWIAPKKADSLVLLTKKAGGQIMVLKADKTATLVKRFGEMQRPNGIVIVQNVKLSKKKQDLVKAVL